MKTNREIEALDIVALGIYEIATTGTPNHAKAVKMLEEAKRLWRNKRIRKCPHCLKIIK